MELKDLQLVVVDWGEDVGLVSLALNKVLVYAYDVRGDFNVDQRWPRIEITDKMMDEAYEGEGTWEDVPDYINNHRDDFGL